MNGYWAKAVMIREQTLLFRASLEETVPEDHPVRLLEELLGRLDWSKWEAKYDGRRGQPPIHPRIMAGAILYGLNRGIRSSRELEDSCGNRIDYLWLVHGRRIDHSTFALFRTENEKELRELGRQVVRLARGIGHIALKEVATDGTRVLADSSRHKTAGARELERWLLAAEEELEQALREMAGNDARDDERYGQAGSGAKLPKVLRKLMGRRDLLARALAAVKEVENAREAHGEAKAEKVAKVPVADPDARVLENKEGGWAPNYTPVVTTDGTAGFIIDADVTASSAEAPVQLAGAERIEESLGQLPRTMMGDGLYTDLEVVEQLERKGIEVLVPAKATGAVPGMVAYREEPQRPVAEQLWGQLPRSRGGRLAREAFVFDSHQDCFYCPLGKCLSFWCVTRHPDGKRGHSTRVYRCAPADCAGCPLRDACIPPRQKYRRVERREESQHWDRVAQRMRCPDNQQRYARRKVIAETPFAHIKLHMGIRRFLHRGLNKVKQEWQWICTAYNLNKLARLLRNSSDRPPQAAVA